MITPDITLYRGFPLAGRYTWSPFVTKLEFRFRFNASKYDSETGSMRIAPLGKIPYISIDQQDTPTEHISDSTLIIQRLIRDDILADLNKDLGPRDKALDIGLRALLEDKLYFYNSYEKWQQNFYTMRSGIFATLPYPVRLFVAFLARRANIRTLWGQGTARFSADEIAAFRQDIWQHVGELLATAKTEKQEELFWVLGGTQPTEVDASLYGFVAGTLVCDAAPESQEVIRSMPVVMDWARRIHDRYFPDYEVWA